MVVVVVVIVGGTVAFVEDGLVVVVGVLIDGLVATFGVLTVPVVLLSFSESFLFMFLLFFG